MVLGGLSSFFSLLIRSFGFTSEQALLYSAPSGLIQIIFFVVSGFLGDRFGQRILVSTVGLILGIVGMIIIIALPAHSPGGRLAGYYMIAGVSTVFVALFSLIATNVAGYTKKTTVAALYLIAYSAGNIIGAQIFRDNYTTAEIIILACFGFCLFDALFIWWYWRRQNEKKTEIRARTDYRQQENRVG